VLQQTEIERLRVVTGGPHAPNPAELLASGRMQQFVSWLREEVDVVVFDSSPILPVTDAAVLSNLADGTILIVDCGVTRKPAAVRAMEQLEGVGAKVLGVVLNRLKPSGDGYYYYYHYYYHDDGDGTAEDDERRRWVARLLRPRRRRRGSRRRRRPMQERVEKAEQRR
jgi:capsular exopolysaccharide synthesis family protein